MGKEGSSRSRAQHIIQKSIKSIWDRMLERFQNSPALLRALKSGIYFHPGLPRRRRPTCGDPGLGKMPLGTRGFEVQPFWNRCRRQKALNPVWSGAPITQLSEEETLFSDSVRKFARDEVAPLVRRMDEEQHLDTALLGRLFELGLMGI